MCRRSAHSAHTGLVRRCCVRCVRSVRCVRGVGWCVGQVLRCALPAARGRAGVTGRQFFQRGLGLLQVGRVESFTEPAVDVGQ
jgi:hypothetical protein